MSLKKNLVKLLWNHKRRALFRLQGFPNNTIQNDERFLNLFFEIYSHDRALLSIREMYNIYTLAKVAENIEGDIAEVGVYKGGSARILCDVKREKTLHLFDTFEGMPDVHRFIDYHSKGDFSDTSLEGVKKYLEQFDGVHFYRGIFPATATALRQDKKFSFVNLDVDIYQSTLSGLEFFYPRLNQGGIILSHDYRSLSCPGVKKAFDEFFSDKPERIIELWDSQCMTMKL
ncbi:MAG: TylF/MycF/NovP-related O-methyltransferase [Candidatus Binatia bacterium]